MILDVRTRWSSRFLMLKMAYDYRKPLILLGEVLKQKDLNHKSCGVVREADFNIVKSLVVLLALLYYLTELSCRDDTSNSVWNQTLRELNDLLVDYSECKFDDMDHKFTATERESIFDSAKSALKLLKKYNESATKNVQMQMTGFFNPYMAINVLARTEGMLLGPGEIPFENYSTWNHLRNGIIDEVMREVLRKKNVVLLSKETSVFLMQPQIMPCLLI